MNELTNMPVALYPEGNRTLDVQLLAFNLPLLTKLILNEIKWKICDRNAIPIFKSDSICFIRIAMHKGAKIIKHIVNRMTSIQMLEGKILFDTDHCSEELKKGHI